VTDRITINLAFPAKTLWQNRRANHWAVARSTKAARMEAWGAAMAAGIARIEGAARYALLVEGYRPTGPGRPHDVQNLPATLKGHIDGIADALGVDDGTFAVDFPRVWAGAEKNGRVVIHVLPVRGAVS
jgi:hypothetical protein